MRPPELTFFMRFVIYQQQEDDRNENFHISFGYSTCFVEHVCICTKQFVELIGSSSVARSPAAAPSTTGASTNGTTLGESMPGTNAGVPKPRTDGAQSAGNADNSGVAPASSSRISSGQKNEPNGP